MHYWLMDDLTGDTRKIFVSNIKTVDESHSARVLIGCKPINYWMREKNYWMRDTVTHRATSCNPTIQLHHILFSKYCRFITY